MFFIYFPFHITSLSQTVGIIGVLKLSIFMSSLGYGYCGDAIVHYSWKTKILVLAGHFILTSCCFVFLSSSKAGTGKEGELLCRAKVEQMCFTLGPVKDVWDGNR